MDLPVLLNTLKTLGVELQRVDDKLKLSAPAGAVTPELAQAIKEHKAAILDLLAETLGGSGFQARMPRVAERNCHPLSPSQERNLFASQNGPGLPTAFALKGPMRMDLMQQVLQNIVDRHASLRTVFREDPEHGTLAWVNPPSHFLVPFIDLTTRPAAERPKALRAALDQTSSQPFDLENGPLFRFHVYRLDREEHVLGVVFSQMVFDGASFDAFIRELTEGYAALIQDRPWPLPEPEAEYVDYVAWNRERIAAKGAQQTEWWKNYLGEEIAGGTLPLDRRRPAMPKYQGSALPLEIPAELLPGLHEVAKASGVTFQMVLLGALFVLAYRLSGQRDCWIATPIEGRTHPALEGMIGTFVNMLLLRAPVDSALSFAEFVKEVRSLSLEAFDHQDIPFDRLGLRVKKEKGAPPAPLFQMEFSYQQVSQRSTLMGPLALSQIEVHAGGSHNELSFWVKDWGHKVAGAVEYSAAVFDEATARHWRECYLDLLRAVVRHPDLPVSQLPLLDSQRDLYRQVVAQSLKQAPAWITPSIAAKPEGLCVVDGRDQVVPFGVWGRAVWEGRELKAPVRLKSDGTWEDSPQKIQEPRRLPHGQRTRVFDPVEFRLIEIFQSVLELPAVGLQDNFFELGGHSSLGVQILNELRRHYHLRLPLAVLFEAPTPFALAKVVRRAAGLPDPDTGLVEAAGQQKWTAVVPIQPVGTRPPLFVAAGIGGNPMNLRFIAQKLGLDQPFYGLQHRGIDGRQRPHKSVHDLAQDYFDSLRAVQPTGPYYLGGFSAGGIAIFEVARKLIEVGEEVKAVFMFDAMSPLARDHVVAIQYEGEPVPAVQESRLKRLLSAARIFVTKRLPVLWDRWTTLAGAGLALVAPFYFRNQAVSAAWVRASRRYQARPLKVDVTVFYAQERDMGYAEPTNGWKPLVLGSLRVIPVSGGHLTHIEEPFIEENVAALKSELDRLQY